MILKKIFLQNLLIMIAIIVPVAHAHAALSLWGCAKVLALPIKYPKTTLVAASAALVYFKGSDCVDAIKEKAAHYFDAFKNSTKAQLAVAGAAACAGAGYYLMGDKQEKLPAASVTNNYNNCTFQAPAVPQRKPEQSVHTSNYIRPTQYPFNPKVALPMSVIQEDTLVCGDTHAADAIIVQENVAQKDSTSNAIKIAPTKESVSDEFEEISALWDECQKQIESEKWAAEFKKQEKEARIKRAEEMKKNNTFSKM